MVDAEIARQEVSPLSVEARQTISQPYIVVAMIARLDGRQGHIRVIGLIRLIVHSTKR
jgi:protein-L-isoaspartate O-methyltransferase